MYEKFTCSNTIRNPEGNYAAIPVRIHEGKLEIIFGGFIAYLNKLLKIFLDEFVVFEENLA